jgi:nitrite reductase (NADH) small subunit
VMRVGQLADFPEGRIRIVDVAGRSIGFYRRGRDVYGVLNVCPHRAAPICRGEVGGTMLPSAPGELEYGLEGWVLRCPWHGWEYDIRSGRAVADVDPRRLRTFPVSVQDEDVYCDVGQATTATGGS